VALRVFEELAGNGLVLICAQAGAGRLLLQQQVGCDVLVYSFREYININ
jgi:hypothetical protein